VLDVSKSLYNFIENGKRKPTIDFMYKLSLLYQTSMDFIYHAYYRQHVIWHFPEHELEYALNRAKSIDMQYVREQQAPYAPPFIPSAMVMECAEFKPYGLDRQRSDTQLMDLSNTAAEGI
jgi:transcriptional regulator with XRE-family HTH domain